MAISVVNHGVQNDHTGTGNYSSVTITGVTAGNLLVVLLTTTSSTINTGTFGDNHSTSYGSPLVVSGSGYEAAWRGVAGASGSYTISCYSTGWGGTFAWAVFELTGTDGSLDASSFSEGNPWTSPSITTTQSADMVLFLATCQSGVSTYTATSPAVEDGHIASNASVGMGHMPAATAGTYSNYYTSNEGTGWYNYFISIAVKATGGPPPVTTVFRRSLSGIGTRTGSRQMIG
jgi:hypothetical protein